MIHYNICLNQVPLETQSKELKSLRKTQGN